MMKLRYIGLLGVFTLFLLWMVASYPPAYHYAQPVLPTTFDVYYQQQLDSSRAHHARPGNEERLVRQDTGKTHLALLYIHGYSASRAEGEYVVDSLSKQLHANAYYLRLPGHGTNMDEQASVSFADYLNDAITTLKMMHQLGDKVIVVGTSMGGLLSTYLAANYPNLVDGLVLCSPFYDYEDNVANLIKVPGMLWLNIRVMGPYRKMNNDTAWLNKTEPGYNDHWYPKQKYIALQSLENLRKIASRNELFDKVKAPTLLMYYYADKTHHDDVASVDAMKSAFGHFNSSNPAIPNRAVAIANGNHVLTSAYVHSNKPLIIAKTIDFLKLF